MSHITLFVQVQGKAEIVEITVPEGVSERDLCSILARTAEIAFDEYAIFVDESEKHISSDCDQSVSDIKRGTRVHVSRCRRIKVMIHFNGQTVDHAFPPGARVKTVKMWAVRQFGLDPKDAAEHVLQICNKAERPSSDTPLHQLVHGTDCAVCFDLIPEKRVEG